MRTLGIGSLVVLGACLLTPPALGMGQFYQIDADGKVVGQLDGPPGLGELINSGPVFHGHWVNGNSEFFFLGDTASLTRFVKRYSGLKNTPLVVVLHAGSARRSELWGDTPAERYDWKVIVLKRGGGAPEKRDNPEEKYVVTVDVWIDHDIRLADLVIPKDVQVKSAGEIEAFVTKHQDPQPAAMTQTKAVETATTFLSTQTWAEDYQKEPSRVVQLEKSWDVYFKHTQGKTPVLRLPNECLIRISKETGEAKRIGLR